MGYSIEVRRFYLDADKAIYSWAVAGGASGYMLVDLSNGSFRPCDADGRPISEMYIQRNVGNLENADPDLSRREGFLTAVVSVIKKWKGGDPPPTAHQFFG